MKVSHDWRMVPFAAAAWVGGFLGTLGASWWPIGGLILAAVLAMSISIWRGWTAAALSLLVFVVVAGLGVVRVSQIHDSDAARWAADGERMRVTVRITTETRMAVERAGTPDQAIAQGKLLKLRSRHGGLELRQDVVIFGAAERAAELLVLIPGASYSFDARAAPTERSSPEPMTLRLLDSPEEVAAPNLLDRLVNQLRGGLRQAASYSPPDQAALVPSLVVGDTELVSEKLSAQFRATALSHLLAVSGANLTLMLSVLLIAVRGIGVRGWGVRIAALLGVGLFVVLCRFEGSVIRAAAMGLVTLLAMGMSSGQRTLRGIAVAVTCLMLIDPWLSRNYAFALSVSACLGICLWAQPWIERMATWAPRWVAEAFCVPLAAQLATQPIITSISGQISVVGVFANVLAAPFVGPTTVLGLIAACVSFLPGLAVVFAWAAGWCVQPIIWIARAGDSLPTAAIAWNSDARGVVASLVLSFGVAALAGLALSRRWASVTMILALLAITVVRPSPLGWPGPWSVVFCDVGQGDATVLRAADGVAVLVDTGPEPRATMTCLQQLGIREIPVLILTHYHRDHIGGTSEVMRRYEPELVVVSPLASPAHAAEAVHMEAEEFGATLVVAEPGQELSLGDVHWRTIGAWQPERSTAALTDGESSAENDASVVGIAEVAGLRVLLPGDVEPAGQRRALAAARDLDMELDAHVLKLPHHGSAAQEAEFFGATGAVLAIASSGWENSYGHPAPAALDLARRSGMSIARTDGHGSIAVALVDGELTVRVTS